MKKISTLLVLLAAAAVLVACAPGRHHQGGPHGPGCANCPHGGPAAAQQAPQSAGTVYWCNCGPECKCNSVSTKPGNCSCGKPMAGGHVVWVEGTTALACTCGPDCTCAIDPKDHTKCGCGKPVKKVDLKGTGLWFCNCGGACGCGAVSDGPGSCPSCGMQLQQAK